MDMIAREAGVSKQTVYSHFRGKAALFGAIIAANSERMIASIAERDPASADPGAVLERTARELLRIILMPEVLARFRLVMAESARFPELAETYYDSGPARVTAELAAYLDRLHRSGVLFVPDPAVAASQFFGMVRGDLFLRGLLRLGGTTTGEDIERVVQTAVASFLAAHDPSRRPLTRSVKRLTG